MLIVRRVKHLVSPLTWLALLCAFSHFWHPQQAEASERGKIIDFEEATVEGVNKRPNDLLQSLNEKNGREGRAHLYNKRRSFQSEITQSLRERLFEYDGYEGS